MNEEIVQVMLEYDEPCMTLKEIANEVGKSKSAVGKRMDELVEDDQVFRKPVGANAVIWWLPERMREPQSGEIRSYPESVNQ